MLPDPVQIYWRAYGGWRALFSSYYFWISIALTMFLVPAWDNRDDKAEAQWVDLAVSILPSMISFSLGAIAILVSLSAGSFFKLISEDGESKSYFMQCVAAFCHFALVQFAALLMALLSSLYFFLPLSILGFFFLVYALATGVAAIFALITIAYLKNAEAGMGCQECGGECKRKCNCDCESG